ncbi:HAD family hydrolase [Acinetobacter sp. AND/436]|uniref:HAD family hydrolase n=1 Tax=Acinetobacter sp. AND/436 TaxID=3414736 RepID=UPI003C2FFAC7
MSKRPYKAVAFDVFGTLIEIKNSQSPYKKMMKWLKQQGRKPQPNDAATIMSLDGDFETIASYLGYQLPVPLLAEMNDDLQHDLKHMHAFEDSIPTLIELKNLGYKLAICSNAATPYGERAQSILPPLDAYAWSFKVGANKPDPTIYRYFLNQLKCQPNEVLFIGDTQLADVDGPKKLGMSAQIIHRKNGESLLDVLQPFLKK